MIPVPPDVAAAAAATAAAKAAGTAMAVAMADDGDPLLPDGPLFGNGPPRKRLSRKCKCGHAESSHVIFAAGSPFACRRCAYLAATRGDREGCCQFEAEAIPA